MTLSAAPPRFSYAVNGTDKEPSVITARRRRYENWQLHFGSEGVPAKAMTPDPTILVLVDDQEIRAAMVRLLKANNYQALESSSAAEAAARAAHEQFDLILLDCDLPLGDSIAAARRIRERAAQHDLPLVVIDTDLAKMSPARELAVSPGEYVIKLIDLDQLINLLGDILHRDSGAAPVRH